MKRCFLNSGRLALSLIILILTLWGAIAYANSEVKNEHSAAAPMVADIVHSQAPEAVPEKLVPVQGGDKDYSVGPDDELTVRIYGEPDLTGEYVVSTSGELSLPLIGDVYVEGMTLTQIKELIVARLKDGYILDPQVSLEIASYRPFYILGEVRVPGSYAYVSNMSILNAVALAGGFTYRANKGTIEIMRTINDTTEVIESRSDDFEIIPGDVILVKERFF